MTGVAYFYYILSGTNVNSFLFILLMIGIIYYFLFRKYTYSLFDPFLLYIIGECFCTVDVFFMHLVGSISDYYYYHYIISQSLLVLGFIYFKPLNLNKLYSQKRSTNKILTYKGPTLIYYISSLSYFILQMYSYWLLGIPLFKEARLSTYAVGGGVGAIGRIIDVTSMVSVFLVIHRYFNFSKRGIFSKAYDICVLLFVIIASFLTGAKSALLNVIYVGFYYGIFYCRFSKLSNIFDKIKKAQWKIFYFALVAALIILIIERTRAGDMKTPPYLALIYRFIQSGDVFMMAYQNNVIEQMQRYNPLVVIFADFLGTFRIMSWDDIPIELGNQLHRYYFSDDLPMGPNPVHNVFGLFYFGYFGSLLYSFCIGFLLSFARNKMIYILPKNVTGGILYLFLSMAAFKMPIDIKLGFQYLNNFIIFGFPLLVVMLLLNQVVNPRNALSPLCKINEAPLKA